MTNHSLRLAFATATALTACATPAAAQQVDRIVAVGDSYADDNNAFQLGYNNAAVLNNTGYSQLLRGDLKNARRFLLKAYELEPENPYIVNNIALLGQSEKSVKRVAL